MRISYTKFLMVGSMILCSPFTVDARVDDFFAGVELGTGASTVTEALPANPRGSDGYATFDASWEAETVNYGIRQALLINETGSRKEALEILRELSVKTQFKNIKAKYFLAKQYILVLESDSLQDYEKKDYLSNVGALLREVETEVRTDNELSEDQKDYYAEGLRDLAARFARLGGSGFTIASATPTSVVSPAVIPTGTAVQPQTYAQTDRIVDTSPARDTGTTNFGGGATVDSRTDPNATNPVLSMNVGSAADLDAASAQRILEGTNLMSRSRNFTEALGRLAYGWTYDSSYVNNRSLTLDSTVRSRNGRTYKMRDLVFQEYTWLKEALAKYPNMPEISARRQPEQFARWTERASRELTALPQSQRLAVMRALMSHESGRIHWRNYRVTMGAAAEVGLGQFMPATAKGQGINPYDPEENIIGIAKYLNQCIRDRGGNLRQGLATYNGGNGNYQTAQAQRYANSVTALV
ncbi:MAG: transglycosylase SLT domain-containing protein [Candidatus Cloacimonetes bacterium]|nr:transglycosylase SLT domain-containing protein [Candidatus Cloacimonadota bacterium]